MANRKVLADRVIQYMRGSYERNKTVKFSSQMVTFAIQQETPEVTKQVIAEVISGLKNRDKKIVSLNEKVPDQRGAVYFTLAEILEKETEPKKMPETKPKVELPVQEKPKVTPLNPFDKVHEKLDAITKVLATLTDTEVKLEVDDMDLIADSVAKRLNPGLADLKEIASSHVTVDGDKLADVINKRLQNLKLGDSFIYAVRKESRGAIEPVWDATKAVNDQTVNLSRTIQERIPNIKEEVDNVIDARLGQYTDYIEQVIRETVVVPAEVKDPNDYRAGIKDGIRMTLEMGLKLDE